MDTVHRGREGRRAVSLLAVRLITVRWNVSFNAQQHLQSSRVAPEHSRLPALPKSQRRLSLQELQIVYVVTSAHSKHS